MTEQTAIRWSWEIDPLIHPLTGFRIEMGSVCKNCMIIHLSNIYTLSRFFKYIFEKEQNLTDVLSLISDRMTEEIALLSHSEL